MDELKESSYLFSLKQLEDLESDRKRRQSHRLAQQAAARKRREEQLAEALEASQRQLAEAELMAKIASEGEQGALVARAGSMVESARLKAELTAARRLHQEQLALSESHAAEMAATRFNSRARLLKWYAAASILLALSVSAVAALTLVQARAESNALRAEFQQRLSAEQKETKRLAKDLLAAKESSRQLTERASRLENDLRETQAAAKVDPPEPVRRGRSPGRSLRQGRGKAEASSSGRRGAACSGGASGDPLNPCLP